MSHKNGSKCKEHYEPNVDYTVITRSQAKKRMAIEEQSNEQIKVKIAKTNPGVDQINTVSQNKWKKKTKRKSRELGKNQSLGDVMKESNVSFEMCKESTIEEVSQEAEKEFEILKNRKRNNGDESNGESKMIILPMPSEKDDQVYFPEETSQSEKSFHKIGNQGKSLYQPDVSNTKIHMIEIETVEISQVKNESHAKKMTILEKPAATGKEKFESTMMRKQKKCKRGKKSEVGKTFDVEKDMPEPLANTEVESVSIKHKQKSEIRTAEEHSEETPYSEVSTILEGQTDMNEEGTVKQKKYKSRTRKQSGSSTEKLSDDTGTHEIDKTKIAERQECIRKITSKGETMKQEILNTISEENDLKQKKKKKHKQKTDSTMSSDMNEHTHLINTLETYPLVKSFIDFNKRVKTVIRRHEVTKNSDLEKELDDLEILLRKPIKVIVVGKYDLELTEIVESTEPLNVRPEQVDAEDADMGLTYIVCYNKTEDVALGLQEMSAVIGHYLITGAFFVANNIYLVCQTDESLTENEIDEIRREALQQMKDKPDQNKFSDHIIVGHPGESICKTIGYNLESKIIRAFANVRHYLIKFIKLKGLNSLKNDRDLYGLVCEAIENVRKQFDMVDDNSAEKKLDCKLLNISSIKQRMSEWYRLPPEICYLVFQDNWKKFLSGQNHVSENGRKNRLTMKRKKDVRTFTENMDRRLFHVGQTALEMRKMNCEIDSAIRKSNLSSEYPESSGPFVVLPVDLEKELCAIDKRITVARFCDIIDINIESVSQIEHVTSNIELCLKKYNFEGAYRVNYTTTKMLNSTIYCGNAIWSDSKRYGTLGLFVRDSKLPQEDNLYALTARHLFAGCPKGSSVFTKNNKGSECVIGKTDTDMNDHPSTHIAAIKVDKPCAQFVNPFVFSEYAGHNKPMIASLCDEELLGSSVFTVGATSKFSRGMICSITRFSPNESIFINITSLAGISDVPYIKEGDSGSISFLPSMEDNEYINALSMNIGVSLGEEPLYISEMLKEGLDILKKHSGLDLSCG